MKKLGKWLEKPWFSNIVTVCVGIVLFMLLQHFSVVKNFFGSIFHIIAPVLIGILIAYLIDPIAVFFENRVFKKIKHEKAKRNVSVYIALFLVLAMIVLFFWALIPSLVSSMNQIYQDRDLYADKIEWLIMTINSWNLGLQIDTTMMSENLQEWLLEAIDYLVNNMADVISISQNVGTAFFNVILGFILCVYFLMGKKSMLSGVRELREAATDKETMKKQNAFLARCHKILIQYIGYDLLDGFIVGAVNAVIMLIFQMPNVALISVIVGVTNLLPTFGPVIGAIIGAVFLLLSNPIYALWFLIAFMVIQTVDGYILKPRLFGGALGIPPIWTLIAIVIGGNLFGVVGILLAIPFAAIITFIYHDSFLPWLREHNLAKQIKMLELENQEQGNKAKE